MSYNVRDDNALFGPLAGVEIPNGAGQSTIVAHQTVEPVGLFGVAGGTVFPASILASTTYTVFIAPPAPSNATGILALGNQYKILGVSAFYSTAAGGAAGFNVEVCAAGVANGSGTQVLSTATYLLNTALATANTPNNIALNANSNTQLIAPGGRVNIFTNGTSTASLVDCTIQIYIARIS